MLADAGMGILSIRVVYWHYSVLQRKLSNKKNGGVALSLRCFTMVGKVVLLFQFNFKI
ncbi:hypothetical protein M083_2070 [Bacteroides fragilis str. 3986 T(B)9]|jgi:hypothetical protein|nr:hypothetical protein M111_1841 [Bacteroides fragilis str. 3986T(B)10]EXY70233.1 hypothetical protein M083_2070 [Bacteroides fragilis str. 3986 T(B)9]EYA52884.1 hypothetical protein M114_1930 [Bacteroides fragilis str. 3986 N(B)22]EYA57578.1 hypothetical protein M112_2123 [Bacteroides fragilis str. 3986 T(B)13]EYE68267.1 hypothetical protein M113_2118 [Bacteroides fragilis str. 3986 N3]